MIVKVERRNGEKIYKEAFTEQEIPMSNSEETIKFLEWKNEILRRKIWTLEKKIEELENIDYSLYR